MVVLIMILAALAVHVADAQDHTIDPTWLHRNVVTAQERKSEMTTPGCHYKPLFGEGDADRSAVAGIARYGEAVLDSHGSCAAVQASQEDQIYVVLQGHGTASYGAQSVVLNSDDYLYIPAGTRRGLNNSSDLPMHVIVMGFRTRGFEPAPIPEHPLKANIDAVPTQTVTGHPSSALYRLLLGDVTSKRDRIAAGRVVTSLFLMEIAPGGTNFPHHHEREEEIYLVLNGHGEMVAGGGTNGIEGKHPAQAGDAYFFRLNCTVGYYSAPDIKTRILAVRSWYPGMAKSDFQH
jgi:mannose-6-phosphate isomerase-like protein (cupin superfamily)